MLIQTKAIIISALKYAEADLIVKAYTLSDGLCTYMLKGVLKSKKGKFKASMFQSLTQLDIVANHRGGGKMEYLKEARVIGNYQTLHTHPVKQAMSMFLAEMLRNTIQEEESNEPLFQYLEYSLGVLDTSERIANFHLLFLLNLTRYLGFQPETEWRDLPVFNLLDGVFQEISTNDYCIEGKNVDLLKSLLGTDFDALANIKLNQTSRNDFLNMLLLYYSLHIEGFRKPKSLSVLNEIFG
ncbi:DNA repair protein RecO [Christiangramia sabulilitoris]|uniref:DNA repair protein RecO n=1 Tax=Christiangramia sabulilitoris TaxID=2583991 RepID=A0A550I8I1_9FLAO|nr:DNA repair protein RecO [Christiangramia sabulilitoris]TRO67274.1 DNA repair protein RecO [Christiangramia sabulilitoris]